MLRLTGSQESVHSLFPERRLGHDLHAAEHQGSCEQPVILITRPVENKGFKTNGASISWQFKENCQNLWYKRTAFASIF